jgi:hypothetical protein
MDKSERNQSSKHNKLKQFIEKKNEKRNIDIPPRINMVTALEFAQCSMYSIRSFVVPNDFSRTKPAF